MSVTIVFAHRNSIHLISLLCILFRYTTLILCLMTFIFLFFYLLILDGEEEIASAEGRGHVVLPVIFFRKDRTLESIEEEERARSRCELYYHIKMILVYLNLSEFIPIS